MSNDQPEKDRPETQFSTWLKSMTDFWSSSAAAWMNAATTASSSGPAEKNDGDQTRESFHSSLGIWPLMAAMLTNPPTSEGLHKTLESLPEVAMRLTRTGWDGYLYLQERWLEKAVKMGEQSLAYQFDNLDQNTFKVWTEIYRENFQQLLRVPQLGLTRFYQENASRAADEFNLFQGALAELLYFLYVPIEKSLQVLFAEMEKKGKEGQLSGEFKNYYNMWIKILEGHYMTLMKSPEYGQVLGKFITALGNFNTAKQAILQDMLSSLPIPTNKEMDELYKELYLLKKKVNEHDRKLEQTTSAGFLDQRR
jgi:class III poly(R)-hydroxyalkanoic acid synthase PhaE subunit